jgi:RNA polymerase sigma-70 factor, ECF subfamily
MSSVAATSSKLGERRARHEAARLRAEARFGGDDPLASPEPLIRRVYAYVAYRLGDGPDAEDVVAAAFERAVRYRHTYDRKRGEPIAWLVGIAKHCMNDALAAEGKRPLAGITPPESGFEEAALERMTLRAAIARLGERDQELLALRYGADLSTKAIGELVGARANSVDVALHRAHARLRRELGPT